VPNCPYPVVFGAPFAGHLPNSWTMRQDTHRDQQLGLVALLLHVEVPGL
jgi:hypothetical protein